MIFNYQWFVNAFTFSDFASILTSPIMPCPVSGLRFHDALPSPTPSPRDIWELLRETQWVMLSDFIVTKMTRTKHMKKDFVVIMLLPYFRHYASFLFPRQSLQKIPRRRNQSGEEQVHC